MTPAQHKKKEPNREHRCDAGLISSEGQVRTSYNSRVLEGGKLCVPWLVRVLGFYSSRVLTSPYWIRSIFLLGVSLGVFYVILSLQESLWVLPNVESKLFPYIHDTWVASNPLSGSSAYTAPSALTPSVLWKRQPLSAL